jgi:hypothetical protein
LPVIERSKIVFIQHTQGKKEIDNFGKDEAERPNERENM